MVMYSHCSRPLRVTCRSMLPWLLKILVSMFFAAMDRCSSAEVCGGVCEVHAHLSPPPEEEPTEDWFLVSSNSLGSRGVGTDQEEEEEEEEQRGEQEKGRPPLKSKLVSAWNSLKYGLCTNLWSAVTQDMEAIIFQHIWSDL